MKKKEKILWPVEELDLFFREAKLPEAPVQLSDCAVIVNVERFLHSHLSAIKKHNGEKAFLPDYERLLKFKSIIDHK